MGDDTDVFGPFEIDREGMRLLRDGVDVGLRQQAVRVLAVLVWHEGTTVTYGELARLAWDQAHVETGTISVTIHEIKEVLGNEYKGYIKNSPRIGYRFERPQTTRRRRRYPEHRAVCNMPITFADNTQEQNKRYLASSIASELATALSRFKNLRIIKTQHDINEAS